MSVIWQIPLRMAYGLGCIVVAGMMLVGLAVMAVMVGVLEFIEGTFS